MSDASLKKRGWKQKIIHEVIEYWMTVAYLALYFGVFTTYRRLILAKHEIAYLNYGVAFFQAFVLGKVILIGDALHLAPSFKGKPLIYPTLFRSVLFTLWVILFSILEHTLRAVVRGEGVMHGLHEIVGKGKYEIGASCLVVFFTFIPFFALRELRRVMGEGRLWRLFFKEGTASNLGGNGSTPAETTNGHQ